MRIHVYVERKCHLRRLKSWEVSILLAMDALIWAGLGALVTAAVLR